MEQQTITEQNKTQQNLHFINIINFYNFSFDCGQLPDEAEAGTGALLDSLQVSRDVLCRPPHLRTSQ